MKVRNLLIFGWLLILSNQVFGQSSDEQNYKNRGFVFSGEVIYTNTSSGEIDKNNSVYNLSDSDVKGAFALGVHAEGGYFILPKFLELGVGTGFDRSYTPNFNLIPLYGFINWYFADKPNSLFLNLSYGCSIPIGESVRRGNLLSLGIGYRFFKDYHYYFAKIGFMARGASLTTDSYSKSNHTVAVRGLSLSFGYTF